MEQKYKGTIKDFPEEIVDRMLECQVEQGNPKDVSVFENNKLAGRNTKGFTWRETKENHDFWSAILDYKKFEKFYERYPKPTISKFEVGKWYTHKTWVPRSFCKATESKSGFSNYIYYSEFICNGEHIVKSDWWCCDEHITLASLEEIQEYLPEGHPDKIKTISEFKKGDYIVTLKGKFEGIRCGKENYCFKARETFYYLKPVIDLAGSNSNGNATIRFDKSDKGCTDWRYATPEEIAEYDRLGKPFDVTTLSKKEIKEWSVGTYVVFLKDYGRSKIGDIDEIIREKSKNLSLKYKKERITTMDSNYTKWFATYEEAKKFSNFLLRTSNFGTDKSGTISDLSYNPCGEIPVIKYYFVGIDPAIMQKPLTVKESYPTKETIKTQVISTNIINIPLKSKKKKQLFTI